MPAALTRMLLVGMSLWLVGAGPIVADAVRALDTDTLEADGDVAGDPCPGCPDEDDGVPCSPLCTDCVCSLGVARVLPSGAAELPPVTEREVVPDVELPCPADSAPSPVLDGLERPPRR